MADGYCEPADVRQALQETELSGPINSDIVETAIEGVSDWFARRTNGHWYDSGGSSNDLVDTSVATVSDVRLDVPSSPHRQDRQLFQDERGLRYPVTSYGPYARVPLPHLYVQTVSTLKVRDRGGDVTDWVASSDFTEGRGDDYYIEREGQHSYGRTYLYVRAESIGPRINYDGLLTLAYDYGLDAQTTEWQDVRRGTALLAAAQTVVDDDVLTAIPDQGQLVSVETQRQSHANDAVAEAWGLLKPYLHAEVA